jgi:bacillithiol biosynthesis cysteine-adding enzyme BshC
MESGCLRQTALPGASKLFADLVYDFPRVARFYAHPPFGDEALAAAAAEVRFPQERRAALVEALGIQNPGHPLLDQLARPEAVAVLTGQQVGLFGGPAYTVYKALAAVKTAHRLSRLGIPAVPVFWLATEDHDFAEVNHAWVFDAGQNPVRLEIGGGSMGRPVGAVELAAPPADALREALRDLPFGSEVAGLAAAAYAPGRTMGEAFAELLKRLLGEFGVLALDPLRPEIRRLMAPILAEAARRAPELVNGLVERNRELAGAGYHAQVHIEPDASLLFLLDGGRRRPLRYREGRFFAGDQAFTTAELAARAADLSPNALLRPVIQDHVLPTAACIGGPAELAYMAQGETLYRALLGRMPVVRPRAFFTVLDARAAKLMARYGLRLEDCFGGLEALRERVAASLTPPELAAEIAAASAAVSRAAGRLHGQLVRFDPTLAEAAGRSRAKMLYQISKIGKKAAREALRRDERAGREASHLFHLLYPRRRLQERVYCFLPLAARHGLDLIGRLYENVRLDSADHVILAP